MGFEVRQEVPRPQPGTSALYIAIEEGCQLGFGESAYLGGFNIAVFEQHEGRNAANAVTGRRFSVVVDVELCNFEATGIFGSNFVEDGRDHLARATPLSPVIDENGAIGAQNLLLKGAVGDVNDLAAHSESP